MAAIGVSPNGRYFVDDEARPFFWLGDTQWELFRTRPPEDAEAILARRKDQGFTAIQVMITGVGDGTKPNAAGRTPWVGNDPAHPDEAYFRNVDRVVDAAGKLGLILVAGVYHQVQRSSITLEKARGYARWLAERYRDAPHIVWASYPEAKPDFIPVLRELAAGLRDGDGGGHLITVHPDPSPTSSSFIHDEEWLAFNMIQPWQSYELLYPLVRADYARKPAKPVVMAEGGYEGVHYTKVHTPLLIRKQAYWSYLAGGHHTYGYAGSHLAPPDAWPSWIGSEGARHMGVCWQILTGLPEWWNLVPDQSILAAGESSGMTLNAAARSSGGRWALVYLSSSTTVSIALERLGGEGPAAASFVDPTTGAGTKVGSVPGTGVMSLSTPSGWEDALLLFERQGRE